MYKSKSNTVCGASCLVAAKLVTSVYLDAFSLTSFGHGGSITKIMFCQNFDPYIHTQGSTKLFYSVIQFFNLKIFRRSAWMFTIRIRHQKREILLLYVEQYVQNFLLLLMSFWCYHVIDFLFLWQKLFILLEDKRPIGRFILSLAEGPSNEVQREGPFGHICKKTWRTSCFFMAPLSVYWFINWVVNTIILLSYNN